MPQKANQRRSMVRISRASGLYGDGTLELRLDVCDEREPYPQGMASGNFTQRPGVRSHWVAKDLQPSNRHGPNYWTGTICYKEQDAREFPYSEVIVWLGGRTGKHRAHVKFVGDPDDNITTLPYRSEFFRSRLNMIFAATEGAKAVTTINLGDYSDWKRPAGLRSGKLSVATVFKRAGFDVKAKQVKEPVKEAYAGREGTPDKWSDKELHDAMQAYWKASPSEEDRGLWVLFAPLHTSSVYGIMFDVIGDGTKYRQGCAIFTDETPFVRKSRGPLPITPGRRRELFATACHEIGHCLNLGHSHERMGDSSGSSWAEQWFGRAEPEALSFMSETLPANYSSNFEYRFSGHDQTAEGRELPFLRHAPEHYVRPSYIREWFEDSRSVGAGWPLSPELAIEARVNREEALFQFMEPVVIELKLTNTSSRQVRVNRNLLPWSEAMTVVITKDSQKVGEVLRPYVRHCKPVSSVDLQPGGSIYRSLFISAGVNRKNGWGIADPGIYTIRVVLLVNGERTESNRLNICVLPPPDGDKKLQERLAQDFFSDDIGRIIAFHGSRFSESGAAHLEKIVNRLGKRRVAVHAAWALGKMVVYDDKRLVKDRLLHFKIDRAKPDVAGPLMQRALVAQQGAAIESFGHIDYKVCADFLSKWLCDREEIDAALKTQEVLYQTLRSRDVLGRRILPSIVKEVKERLDYVRKHRKWPSPQTVAGRGETS